MELINPAILSWRKLIPPAAAPRPFQHHCPRTALHWRCDSPTLLLPLQLNRSWDLTPDKTPELPFLQARNLKGTEFINLERHKSSQSSAPPTMSPGSTGEDLGMLLQPWPAASDRTDSWQNPLRTPSWSLISGGSSTPKAWILWRTVFCISVGEFGLVFFGFVWFGLGLFTIFIETALMAVYNSRLGVLVLLSKVL